MQIQVMANILEHNEQQAAEIAKRLEEAGVFALNVMGSPGSGKTSLLEKTIAALKGEFSLGVIEGDLFTAKDAERIEQQGVPVVQINTAGGCHLNAHMILQALDCFQLSDLDLLIIENVGNLVCPAEFYLGEKAKVTVLSITEGDDKPLKYPLMFKESSVALLNKLDLLPYTDFNMQQAVEDIKGIHPDIQVLPISCRENVRLEHWYAWLRQQLKKG